MIWDGGGGGAGGSVLHPWRQGLLKPLITTMTKYNFHLQHLFPIGRERGKRRYSPARHTEENPAQSNGSTHHNSISEFTRSLDKEPPITPQYDTIPVHKQNHHHIVYDSLLAPVPSFPPAPPSLPPPHSSMSSLAKPALPDSANTSTGHLSQASSSIIRQKLRGSAQQVNMVDIRETRRQSSSVPDMTIDYPIEFLEPDLLELERMHGDERTHAGHFDQTSLGLQSDV